jgi:SAM-dependent methyltransferase
MRSFEELVDEAASHEFTGWDFSFIADRVVREGTPWDYTARVNELASGSTSMLDLGTGGGEFFSEVSPRPPLMVATESYAPNVAVAAGRLTAVGAHVVAAEGAHDNAEQAFDDRSGPLPFRDAAFDVVIDRHTAFRATEVAGVLTPGGTFYTQQVGARDCIELCEALGGVTPCPAPSVDRYVEQLTRAGLEIVVAREAFCAKTFLDVGALLGYVLPIPWAFRGFSLETHLEALRTIHERGPFTCSEHRLLFEARKP